MSENTLKSRWANLRDHRSGWAHDTVGGLVACVRGHRQQVGSPRNLRHSIQDSRFLFKAETLAGIHEGRLLEMCLDFIELDIGTGKPLRLKPESVRQLTPLG